MMRTPYVPRAPALAVGINSPGSRLGGAERLAISGLRACHAPRAIARCLCASRNTLRAVSASNLDTR